MKCKYFIKRNLKPRSTQSCMDLPCMPYDEKAAGLLASKNRDSQKCFLIWQKTAKGEDQNFSEHARKNEGSVTSLSTLCIYI